MEQKINSVGRYTVGIVVILYIICLIFGDFFVLGMIGSWLVRTIFLILCLIPIQIAWKGYKFSLVTAQTKDTKKKAWIVFLFYALGFLVVSYLVGSILGFIAGSFI
jgi:hypothetical protein